MSKLTLSIDDRVIANAKEYAQRERTSISQLVSRFLSALVGKDEKVGILSSQVRNISGVLKTSYDKDELRERYHQSQSKKHQ